MSCSDEDRVEDAEAAGDGAGSEAVDTRVMARRPHEAQSIPRGAGEHRIDGGDDGTGSAPGCGIALAREARIRSEAQVPLVAPCPLHEGREGGRGRDVVGGHGGGLRRDQLHIRRVVDTEELGRGRLRRGQEARRHEERGRRVRRRGQADGNMRKEMRAIRRKVVGVKATPPSPPGVYPIDPSRSG